MFFPSLSPSLTLSLKINEICFFKLVNEGTITEVWSVLRKSQQDLSSLCMHSQRREQCYLSPGREHEGTECLLVPGSGSVMDWLWGNSCPAERGNHVGVSKDDVSPIEQPQAIMSKFCQLNTLISKEL